MKLANVAADQSSARRFIRVSEDLVVIQAQLALPTRKEMARWRLPLKGTRASLRRASCRWPLKLVGGV